MCSAKLVRRYFDMITVFVCVSFFFQQGNSLELIFSLSFGRLTRIGATIQKYTKEVENEREKDRRKNTGEKALNGDRLDKALAALTRDQSVWYPLCLAVPGADIDKDMETQLKNHIVPLSRRWELDNQKTKIRRVYQPNYILNKFLIKQILQEIRWFLGNLIGYYYLSVRVDVKVF